MCVDTQMNITHYGWSHVRLSWKQVTRVQQTWLARNVDYDDKISKYNVVYVPGGCSIFDTFILTLLERYRFSHETSYCTEFGT